LLVRPNGHIVMRFKSNNPGVWLFHCHIEWHVDSGLIMTFVEQPLTLQKTLPSRIPADHYAACSAMDPPMPTVGNAAANTEDFYDLSGANVSPAPLPDGFLTKGIVAMTFSILAGLLGVGTIVWYGLGEMGRIEEERERRKIERVAKERGVLSRANTGAGVGGGQEGPEEISRIG